MDSGPNIPVTTNLAAGHLPLKKFMKGMDALWPIDRKLFPKTACKDYSKTLNEVGMVLRSIEAIIRAEVFMIKQAVVGSGYFE